MKYSYHSHTRWCNHADGEISDYIEEAVRQGFELFTICDHTPDDQNPFGPRASWQDLPAYLQAVQKAEEQYSGRIRLLRGFEAEYYPEMMHRYQELKDQNGFQVWILGQHESADHRLNYYHMKDLDAEIRQYTADLLDGLATGFFPVLAHPDLVILDCPGHRPVPVFLDCMRQLFAYCEAHQIVVELNANGFRGGKGYPCREVWEMSREYHLRYLISSDAHAPAQLNDRYVAQTEQFAEQLGIHPEVQIRWQH